MNILVIDDSETVRIQMGIYIRSILEAEVTMAGNGLEAIHILKDFKGSYDVIFCDINMPVMGGIDFIKRVKKDQLSAAPIVIITTESKAVQKIAKVSGAAAWITKPFEIEHVEAVIHRIQENKSKATAAEKKGA